MAKRTTPELNLQKELPQVLSTDFNLFYKPEAKPVDPSVELFTKSLDRFVSGAGTDLVIAGEIKEKKVNEAQAIKDYNENKAKFSKAVKSGTIPKEANPYYIQKLQELDLNSQAEKFKGVVSRAYVEKNVLENPDPDAFNKFYNDELKKFVKDNNIAIFSPEKLEQGFFSKTSSTRASLLNTHVQSQMGKIKDDYKKLYKEGIQTFFDPTKTIEEIGEQVELFIKDKTNNGLGNVTARDYFLETLSDYANNTNDLEFASRLLRELPKNITLGTDTIFNNKAIKDDLDAIREIIDDRIIQEENEFIETSKNRREIEYIEAEDFTDKYDTLSEAKKDPEYNGFSNYKKSKIEKIIKDRADGFGSEVKPFVDGDINEFLKDSNFEGALEYLNNNINNVTQTYYYKAKEEIKAYKFTGKDGLLASDFFVFYKLDLESIAQRGNKSSRIAIFDELIGEKLELKARKWLQSNPANAFPKSIDRETEFEDFIGREYSKMKATLLGSGSASFEDTSATTTGQTTIEENQTDTTPIIITNKDLE